MTDLKNIKCFMLDLDGTVYLSKKIIPGAAEAIGRMRKQGRVLFVTNNSSMSSRDYLAKLNEMGLKVKPEEIYTSALSAIDYLKEYHKGKKVFLLGTPSLKIEFAEAGIPLSSVNPDIVMLGFDKTLSYRKLVKAAGFLNRGAFFAATHPDITCPTDTGSIPDVGSFLALFKSATGREPDIICGKPFAPFAKGALMRAGVKADEAAMFGDRLSTDMRFALENSIKAVLVLSGESTRESLTASGLKVDLVLESISYWDAK